MHEMEHLNCLVNAVHEQQSRCDQESCVSFNSVVEACKRTMPAAVDQPVFKDMFDFVINLGRKNAGFAQRLFEYERRFVDHKKRRLPPQIWASVN